MPACNSWFCACTLYFLNSSGRIIATLPLASLLCTTVSTIVGVSMRCTNSELVHTEYSASAAPAGDNTVTLDTATPSTSRCRWTMPALTSPASPCLKMTTSFVLQVASLLNLDSLLQTTCCSAQLMLSLDPSKVFKCLLGCLIGRTRPTAKLNAASSLSCAS